jgi:ferredoxin--NADP+ reductase
MMKAVSDVTRPHAIPTFVSLNPIMMDGTGMCGACRVNVNNEIKFACVDGPEFNGHDVDFDLLMARQKMYLPQEKLSMDIFERQCKATPRMENSSW